MRFCFNRFGGNHHSGRRWNGFGGFRGCQLRGCQLRGCQLRGCQFRGCQFRGCQFRGCQFRSKDWSFRWALHFSQFNTTIDCRQI
ncbi:pentapeptide repeat-containing protein [Novipirellula herctigrandis]|uniref:pentapeptide repeat-containing protein n=1 Tax=Novipirellula herctigrandis TaxID=2527986 RepID=UPI003AF3841C